MCRYLKVELPLKTDDNLPFSVVNIAVSRPQTARVPIKTEGRENNPTKMKTTKAGDLGQGLKSEMQNSKRRLSGIFDGSKNKQEKATAPKGAAAVHIGWQCRPKNSVVTAFSGDLHRYCDSGLQVHLFQTLVLKTGLQK